MMLEIIICTTFHSIYWSGFLLQKASYLSYQIPFFHSWYFFEAVGFKLSTWNFPNVFLTTVARWFQFAASSFWLQTTRLYLRWSHWYKLTSSNLNMPYEILKMNHPIPADWSIAAPKQYALERSKLHRCYFVVRTLFCWSEESSRMFRSPTLVRYVCLDLWFVHVRAHV